MTIATLTEAERGAICAVVYLLVWLSIALVAAWHGRRERALVPSAPPPDPLLGFDAPVVDVPANEVPEDLIAAIPVLYEEDAPRDTIVDVDDITLVSETRSNAPEHTSDVPSVPFAEAVEELAL